MPLLGGQMDENKMSVLLLYIRDDETVAESDTEILFGYMVSCLSGYFKCEYRVFYPEESLCDGICASNPIITIINFTNCKLYDDLLNEIKKHSHSKICIWGVLPSLYPEKFFENVKDTIDYIIIGEPEKIAFELCKGINEKKDFKGCNGLFGFWDDQISMKKNHFSCRNLDLLPLPKRLDDKKFKTIFSISGSRGCYGKCSFCAKNLIFAQNNSPVRYRSVNSIINEIDFLVKKYNCKYISFLDATFCPQDTNEAHNRLNDLYNNLKDKNYWVQFFLHLRLDNINQEIIEDLINLKTVGLHSLYIGLESGNDNDLNLYNKNINSKKAKDSLSLLKEMNDKLIPNPIIIQYGFINFNKWSSIKSLKENIQFLQNNRIVVNISMISFACKIIKGTKMFCSLEKTEFFDTNIYESIVNYDFDDRDVKRVYDILNEYQPKIYYSNFMGYTTLAQRYLHFKKSIIAQQIIDLIKEYHDRHSCTIYQIYTYILEHYHEFDIKEHLDKMVNKYNAETENMLRKIRHKKERLSFLLNKINELVY
jgi:hypothetical protein